MDFRCAPAPHRHGIQRSRFGPTAYIYTSGPQNATPKKTETQESSAAEIPFRLTFLALKRLSDRTFRDGAPAGPPFDPENV